MHFEKYDVNEHTGEVRPNLKLDVMSDSKIMILEQAASGGERSTPSIIVLNGRSDVEALIEALKQGLEIAPE